MIEISRDLREVNRLQKILWIPESPTDGFQGIQETTESPIGDGESD